MTKSKTITWVGHVASKGEIRNACIILIEKLKEKNHSDDLYVDGVMALECVLGK